MKRPGARGPATLRWAKLDRAIEVAGKRIHTSGKRLGAGASKATEAVALTLDDLLSR